MTVQGNIRPFTDEQAVAVDRREGPLLVAANAGSGKTTVLAERFVRSVLEDDLPADALLAITFTDKAAGELRARIRDRFVELGERDRARDAQDAPIGTIHGFCASVLRAHAVLAGLDPAFTVLDESAARALRVEAFDRAFAAFLDGEAPDRPRLAALDLAAAWTPDRLRDAILGVHDELRSRGASTPRLPPAPTPAPLARLHAQLLAAAADALDDLRTARSSKSVDAARDALQMCIEQLGTQPAAEAAPLATLAAAAFKQGTSTALRGDRCERYLEAHRAYAAACRDYQALPVHALLDELLASFAAQYAAAKTKARALDYDDLELHVRDLFVAQPSVAAAYAARFARIMVDELQDTNPLQLEILGHLDRGNVFLVGDELQAIYGFRHADVDGFRRKRDELPSAQLTINWRAQPEILETLNGAFGDLHERYAPLRPGRPAQPPAEPRVELLLIDKAAWEDAQGALGDRLAAGLPAAAIARHAEARAVARRVRMLVDGDGVRPQDVVVLLRAATDMTLYERALELEGLATLATGGRGFWARRQVQDLLAYLAALTNPRDESALWTLLASPLVDLSSDALALIALGSRERGVAPWELVEDPAQLEASLDARDGARLEAFREWFQAERAVAPRLALAALLDRAIGYTGYDLRVLELPGGRRRLANVFKLVRLAAAFEARRGRDVRGFIDHATAELEADAREPEAPVELAELEAVRLMTIHAAKGLEFPVVVLADLGRRGNAAIPDLLVDGDRVGVRLVGIDGRSEGAFAFDELKSEAQAAQLAEERRVLHVALTRAQERLIMSGSVCLAKPWPSDGPAAPPLAWLGPALAGDPAALLPQDAAVHDVDEPRPAGRVRIRVSRVAPATAAQTVGLVADAAPGADEGASVSAAPAAAPPPAAPTAPAAAAARLSALSYSALSAYSACAYRFYLERVVRLARDDDDDLGPPAAGAGALDARVRGTLVHELLAQLELADPQPPAPADVLACARRIGAQLEQADVEDVRALVTAFCGSELCARIAGCTDVRREHEFSFVLDDDGPLLTGVVDVHGREGERALVVDYKSDRLGDDADLPALVERDYGAQRRIYALAELRAGARAVEVVHLYLERPRDPAAVLFTQADVGRLEDELRALLGGLAEGRFPVAAEPHRALCAGCPGRRALCSHDLEATSRELAPA